MCCRDGRHRSCHNGKGSLKCKVYLQHTTALPAKDGGGCTETRGKHYKFRSLWAAAKEGKHQRETFSPLPSASHGAVSAAPRLQSAASKNSPAQQGQNNNKSSCGNGNSSQKQSSDSPQYFNTVNRVSLSPWVPYAVKSPRKL